MESNQLIDINITLTDNNKLLLKHVLEPMIDEIAFSEPNKVFLKHGGVVGDYLEYEKALTLLKKIGIINDFRNMRYGKPVDNGSVHVVDSYEITYEENTLLEFARLLNNDDGSTHQIKPSDTKISVASKSVDQSTKKIDLHPLQPKHYSDRTGKLALSPTTELSFAIKGNTIRKNGKPYLQCKLMGQLFRNVKTIKSGIFFSTFYGVHERYIDKKMEKKIRNTVSEINKKVAEVGGPKNLIYVQNKKVCVNHSYL